jgi:hypothetical protein
MQLPSQPYLARLCLFTRLHHGLINPFQQARLRLYVSPIPQMSTRACYGKSFEPSCASYSYNISLTILHFLTGQA